MEPWNTSHRPRSSRLEIVSGGARSGKSRFAVAEAIKSGQRRLFVATAEAYDDEMRERIRLHQVERQNHFDTLDAPRGLHLVLEKAPRYDVILIDCLTLWVSNLMLGGDSDAEIQRQVQLGLYTAMQKAPHVILVSNELGLGIVPDNALARHFRDLNGRLQQDIASDADEAYFAALGIILPLKRLAQICSVGAISDTARPK